jgi:hypothetical protein
MLAPTQTYGPQRARVVSHPKCAAELFQQLRSMRLGEHDGSTIEGRLQGSENRNTRHTIHGVPRVSPLTNQCPGRDSNPHGVAPRGF